MKWLRRVFAGVGALLVFVLALLGGILIHSNLAATRAVVRTQVSRALDGVVPGDITILGLDELHPGSIAGARIVVRDPTGVVVIDARDVSARLRTFELVRSLLRGRPHVDILEARAGDVFVDLDSNDQRTLRLIAAFVEQRKRVDVRPKSTNGMTVQLDVRDAFVAHAAVEGRPAGAPFPIDAEAHRAAAKVRVDEEGVHVTLNRARIETSKMPADLDARGTVGGKLVSRAHAEGTEAVGFDAAFDGRIGGMPTWLDAHLERGRVNASLDVEDPNGARASSLASELDVADPIVVRATVSGDLPRVAAKLAVGAGSAEATVDGTVVLGETVAIEGVVSARNVDLARIVEGAPSSSLGLEGQARAELTDSGPVGDFDVRTLAGMLAGKKVPPATIRGTVREARADARLLVDAPTLKAEISASIAPVRSPAAGAERVVDVDAHVAVPALTELPVAGELASGSLRASVGGHILLPSTTFDGTLALAGDRIAIGDASASDASVRAEVSGTARRPSTSASLDARGVRVGPVALSALDARARITKTDEGLVIDEARARATRDGRAVVARAGTVVVSDATTSVEDAVVEGLGAPIRASLDWSGDRVHARIEASAIDLARVGSFAGMPRKLRGGTASASGEITLDPFGLHGAAHVEARDAAVANIEHASAVVDFRARGRELDADVHAALDAAGHVDLTTRGLELHGRPTSGRAWVRATGSVAFDVDVDLERAASLAPKDLLPVQTIEGRFAALGHVRRGDATNAPEVSLHAQTRGLVLASHPVTSDVRGASAVAYGAPFRVRGIDASIDVRSDAPSGFFEIAAGLYDRAGPIVAADLKTRLPYEELVRDPDLLREVVLRAPLDAKLVIPERPIAELPEVLALQGYEGTVGAEIDVVGPLIDPRLRAALNATELCVPGAPLRTPMNAHVKAAYEGDALVSTVAAETGDREVVDLSSRVELRMRDLLEHPLGDIAWTASARGRIRRFPLSTLPPIGGRALGGTISGDVTLDGLHENARARAEITIDDPTVGTVHYDRGRITAFAGAGAVGANARLERSGSHIDARASGGLVWGSRLVPAIDESHAFDARLQAKRFDLSVTQPFVAGELAAIDGIVDANASLLFDPRTGETSTDGTIALREGSVHVIALGQELHDVRAKLKLARGGRIEIEDVYARAADGEVAANGSLQLDGLRLEKAKAEVRIPEKRPIDLVLSGQPVGEVWGRASLESSTDRAANTMTISVDVPMLGIELPQNLKSGVQELEERKKILVGHYRHGRFVQLPLDRTDVRNEQQEAGRGLTLAVNVALHKAVITRGRTLEVTVEGDPSVVVGDETRIRGRIRATEGTIDVQGKEFEIQQAIVTFDGSVPPNPTVVATAAWTAADGTRVFADFVGPAKSGDVRLRSDPPRPQHEILALVLFGTADGANPTPIGGTRRADGTTKTAVSLGGGLAADGLTEAIDDLTGVQATARIDTTLPNNPRPQIEFQLTPTISVEFARVIGTPPLFAPDKTLATFEWRFVRNWSLETTLGDHGTAKLDALWRKRY